MNLPLHRNYPPLNYSDYSLAIKYDYCQQLLNFALPKAWLAQLGSKAIFVESDQLVIAVSSFIVARSKKPPLLIGSAARHFAAGALPFGLARTRSKRRP